MTKVFCVFVFLRLPFQMLLLIVIFLTIFYIKTRSSYYPLHIFSPKKFSTSVVVIKKMQINYFCFVSTLFVPGELFKHFKLQRGL